MTLHEAITILEKEQGVMFIAEELEYKQATRLGIEALKRIQLLRKYETHTLLPGETNQCPFAVYPYECEKDDCTGCSIRIGAATKANEEIAGNMEDYWKYLRCGAEK